MTPDYLGPRVTRVPVADDEPLIGSARYDYADAFEVRVAEPDPRSAEQLARLAIEHAPWPVRYTVLAAWRMLLRFQLGSRSSADHILGARIVASEADVVHLEGSGGLMRGVIIARKLEPTRTVATTYLFYKRPVARFVWAIAGVLHRRIAPYLLLRAAALRSGARAADRTRLNARDDAN